MKTINALLIILLLSTPLFAHKINIFADYEGDEIKGLVYFSGGKKAKNVSVKIYDSDQNVLADIKTSDNGEFSFTPEKKVSVKLLVETIDGHKASINVKSEEDTPAPETVPVKATTAVSTDIETIVKKAVAKEVYQLKAKIDEYENKIRIRDIIGGIGYILGFMGMIFYFKTKGKTA